MQTRPFAQSLASTTAVVLATIMLAACGPGGSASPQAVVATNAPERSDAAAQALDVATPPPPATAATDNVANGFGASALNATSAANAADFASSPVASVQASLAADSEQVAPVMSYAPGDDPPPSSTGDHSSSTATTTQ
ncbi:hypothetical protein [Paraburkholderia oxyphila]|uniref:hypothetical protein n=1 Tax=Paraburkholderia oxyphila TaxID=614212 RepID=UPI0005BB35E3|nr:hypothetical protein [Paraburkholderia oxyphila]